MLALFKNYSKTSRRMRVMLVKHNKLLDGKGLKLRKISEQ